MKKKKETKKLILNKISIAQLDNDKMNQVKGKADTSSQVTKCEPINTCV